MTEFIVMLLQNYVVWIAFYLLVALMFLGVLIGILAVFFGAEQSDEAVFYGLLIALVSPLLGVIALAIYKVFIENGGGP